MIHQQDDGQGQGREDEAEDEVFVGGFGDDEDERGEQGSEQGGEQAGHYDEAAQELLDWLRGIASGSGGHAHVESHLDTEANLQDVESIPNELLLDAFKIFHDEWSSYWNAYTTRDACSACPSCRKRSRTKMSVFEWSMGCDHSKRRFALWADLCHDSVERRASVTPRALTIRMCREKYILFSFYQAMLEEERSLIVATAEEEASGEGYRMCVFKRIAEVINSSYNVCLEEIRVRINLPDRGSTDSFLLHESISEEDALTSKECMFLPPSEMTPFHELHEHMLRLLKQRNLRKIGDELYREITVTIDDKMYRTYAWEKAYQDGRPSTFETFFIENVSRYVDFAHYLNSTAPLGTRNEVLKQLAVEEEPECRTLNRSRLFISFRNCIMHLIGPTIFPYGDESNWQAIADAKNKEIADFASMSAALLFTKNGLQHEPFDLSTKQLIETGDTLVVRPPHNDEAAAHFIDEMIPPELMTLRLDGQNYSLSANDDSVAYNPADPWTHPLLFEYLNGVYTPEFDAVQKCQDFTTPTRLWDLATLGRAMLPGRSLDTMHLFTMHQGRAGTGKSLKIQALEDMMPPQKFGILSASAAERTFWATGKADVWCLAWLEASNKERPPISKGDFQQMVAYENVCLPQKNKPSIDKRWTAPLFVAGNSFPAWEDESGSLRRRCLTFLYNNRVKVKDPSFEIKMKRRLGPLLIKMMHSYLLMLCIFPSMDWQMEIPMNTDTNSAKHPIIGQQLHDFMRRASEHLDPLEAFINSGRFVFGQQHNFIMPETAFVADYNHYREHFLGMARAKWNSSHYTIVFESKEITRANHDYTDPSTGVTKPCMCLFGLAPRESDEF